MPDCVSRILPSASTSRTRNKISKETKPMPPTMRICRELSRREILRALGGGGLSFEADASAEGSETKPIFATGA